MAPLLADSITDSVQAIFGSKHAAIYLAATVTLLVVIIVSQWQKYQRNKLLPPMVPYSDAMNGSTEAYAKAPTDFLNENFAKYGPVYRTRLMGIERYVVGKEYCKDIFTDFHHFDFAEGTKKRFNTDIILGTDRLISSSTARAAVVKFITPSLTAYTPRIAKSFGETASSMQGDVEHLYPVMLKMIARAMATVFVGERLGQDEDVTEIFQNVTAQVGQFMGLGATAWYSHYLPGIGRWYIWFKMHYSDVIKQYHGRLEKKIAQEKALREKERKVMGDERWNKEKPLDVLQLLNDQGKDLFDGREPTPQELMYLMIALIFASVHTTTVNSVWTLYVLASHPQYLNELHDEIKTVTGATGTDIKPEDITPDTVKRLVKVDSAVREMFRWRGDPFSVDHLVRKDTHLHGYLIPKGAIVTPAVYRVHRDEETFASSDEYNPFRFVSEYTETDATNKGQFNMQGASAVRVDSDYLPFGIGRHVCPGRFIAVQEIKTVVALLVYKYHIELPNGYQHIAMHRRGEIPPMGTMRFTPRK